MTTHDNGAYVNLALDDLAKRIAVAANAEFTEPLRLLADVVEYAEHGSWRCEYRTRYKTCRCGLDDLMERLGLPPVAVADPEANAR